MSTDHLHRETHTNINVMFQKLEERIEKLKKGKGEHFHYTMDKRVKKLEKRFKNPKVMTDEEWRGSFVVEVLERLEKLESWKKKHIKDWSEHEYKPGIPKEDKPTNCEHEIVEGHTGICNRCKTYIPSRRTSFNLEYKEKPKDSRCKHWNSNWDACEILDENKRDKEIERLNHLVERKESEINRRINDINKLTNDKFKLEKILEEKGK